MAQSSKTKLLIAAIDRLCDWYEIPLRSTHVTRLVELGQIAKFSDFVEGLFTGFDYSKVEKITKEQIDGVHYAFQRVAGIPEAFWIHAHVLAYVLGMEATIEEAQQFVDDELRNTPVRGVEYMFERWLNNLGNQVIVDTNDKLRVNFIITTLRDLRKMHSAKKVVVKEPDIQYELPKKLLEKTGQINRPPPSVRQMLAGGTCFEKKAGS